ncbi:Hypothetical predicted protein [Mytilus galloprovincialis]|uniref:Reverse transcriptase domain-containing protein n=1 Tax=Mytilus galloprovincialis TaxID=29158 RepID=A0A8B6F9C9_MYTGA|nr:Hypothetical predicted protein [Mytilus galloprovincialis]
MPRGNSKKGTPARGQGVKRRRMTDPKEKEQPIATVVNPRSSGESVIDFSSDPGTSQTSIGTESNIFNENIQFSQSLPCLEESLFDQIGCYVPMKLKDKIWKHEFIDLNVMIKSPRELANFPDHEGDLVVKGGHMRIESLPCRAIPNIHTWTSAFMIYMSILLEKQSSLAQELLKYMRDIRFAANKSHGWGTYDEQFRLRKAQRPQSSWAVINQDLWSFYITTAMRDQGQSNESKVGFSSQSEPLHSFRQSSGQQNVQQPRTCNAYNTKGKRCNFNPCRFKHGCSACGGPRLPTDSKKLKSAIERPDILLKKIKKEIDAGRVAGPFKFRPIPTLRISPLGLVPKGKDGQFRVIHNLSYPENSSVNDFIDPKKCSVVYSNIDDAVDVIKLYGNKTLASKSDVRSAFRLLPISPIDFDLLGFKINQEFYFDKSLPFGASISCALFNKFASFLHWAVSVRQSEGAIVHYLDDFLFLGRGGTCQCADLLHTFKVICNDLGIPLADEKTISPTTRLTFLGVEIDTSDMTLRLPSDKLDEIASKNFLCFKMQEGHAKRNAIPFGFIKLCMSRCRAGESFL